MDHPLLKTLDQLVRQQTPNFFRLYLNPHVVQTCFCLGRLAREVWYGQAAEEPEFQTFLANSFDEALSGALKLARFCASRQGRPKSGLLLGGRGRLEHFASLSLGKHGRLELLPGLILADGETADVEAQVGPVERFGYVVLFPPADCTGRERWGRLLERLSRTAPLVIAAVSRAELDACRRDPSHWWDSLPPDVVVFDESFVHHHVPWGALSARKSLYDHWNRPGYSTFHSTTFQPNSVSALHFLRCLQEDDPGFIASAADELRRIASEPAHCQRLFARLYSPSLGKTISSLGFADRDVTAAGHYVTVAGRPIFDGVAGIACSMRGHNPPNYVRELMDLLPAAESRQAVCERLRELTGLDGMVPAVSGASAVENALRLGLAARFPQKYVLALQGGFGGKTLFALTGTAKPSYKEGLDPLYESVLYVDPFGDQAIEELACALNRHPVGVVQLELIQAVGGVRAVPERVVRYLDEGRRRWGYALFVDEVQTGMYRTGPFTMSERYGITPDLLTIGKGTSDMMFPFAVTLYSAALREQLDERSSDLCRALRAKADYEFGYRTLLNTLERARSGGAAERVREAGALFSTILTDTLASCPAVRDVRVFGLLIAIELDTSRSFRRWFRRQAPFLYIVNMLLHHAFPLLIGYCQYEPNVLKLTPPLSITREEIERVCATIRDVLRAPASALFPPALGLLARTYMKGKWKGFARRDAIYEPVKG
jgi:acetylornithine/succinyldiaminopimelate/putrescine aminotransferase